MSFISTKLSGVSSSIGAFEEMKNGVRNRVVRKSVYAGTVPMNRAAKVNKRYRDRTGLLRKSMGRKVKTYRNSGITIGVIGPRRGFARTVNQLGAWSAALGRRSIRQVKINPANYAHLVEHGHGGPAPAPPKNFLQASFNSSRSDSQEKFTSKFNVEVLSEAAKAYAKQRSSNG